MARAAVIPGVASTEPPPARATRGRGRTPQSEETTKTAEPAKRGRKPGKTGTAAGSNIKQKKAAVSKKDVFEDSSTDDEIRFDSSTSRLPAAAAKVRAARPVRAATPTAMHSDQEQSDDEEIEDDDDELAQLEVTRKKAGRPKTKAAATKAEKTKSAGATATTTKATRGRPKAVKSVEPVAEPATTTTRKTRGRPAAAKPEVEKKIYVATASTTSSFAKARPTGGPAIRKKVTFADLSGSENEASAEEQQPANGARKAAAAGKAQSGSGLKAKPLRKTAGTTGRGRPPKSQSAAKPLSPKKATQLTKSSSASSGDDDELAGEKTVYSLVVQSPIKNQVQHTGLSSPVKRINFTGATATPSRTASRVENDENSLPGVQPPSAIRDAAFLGSPARRPPSPSKESISHTPRRGHLFNTQFQAPSTAQLEASTPTRLSPLKLSPKKGPNLGVSFLGSPEKGLSTPFNAKLSLLQSPAKRIQSPFVFQKVGKSSTPNEDVDMDGNASNDYEATKSNREVEEFSDDEISMDTKLTLCADNYDDVFVEQPATTLNDQQDIAVADYADGQDSREQASIETTESKSETTEESNETPVDDEMDADDVVMDVEHEDIENNEGSGISGHIDPVEGGHIDQQVGHQQDCDEMEDDADAVIQPNPDSDEQEAEHETEVEVSEETEQVELDEHKLHEAPITASELETNHLANESLEKSATSSVTNDRAEDAVMYGEYEDEDQSVSEIKVPESPAMSHNMSTNSIPAFRPDEIDEVASVETTRNISDFVPPAAPSPPANPSQIHPLMFSYRDNRDDSTSEYDPSPIKRRSIFSYRESILPQTPSASETLPFSPLAAQLSQWKASSPEKNKQHGDRPQSSIFSPVIPNQLRMKSSKNRYSQIQTMRHSLAAKHSLANSTRMDDDETDTVERQSEPKEQEPDQATETVSHTQQEYENDDSRKAASDKEIPVQPLPMSITPVRVNRDPHRTVHTVSKVPLRPEGEISPIKFPRKRARAKSIDIDLPIRASPHRVKLVPKGRLHPSSPRKPLAELEFDGEDEPKLVATYPTSTVVSPKKTPGPVSKAEEQVLRGAVVFVDVHTTEGEDASGIFVELLTQMGAKCVKSWSWNPRASQSPVDGVEPINNSKVGITHVVYKDGGVRTMEKVRQAGDLVKCVGVGWVLDCERENKWLDESCYNVDSTIIPRGGAKRRKSMQPRALANVNGSLMSSTSSNRYSRNSPEWEGTMENFRRMSPNTPPSAGESFLSRISNGPPKTPTPDNSDGTYEFKFDFSAMSPATPYFLSQPSRLVQQTCPPKQINQGLFPSAPGSESKDNKISSSLRAKLEAARRKSLAFKPRLESPLSRS
ncbi:hypothetical protein BGW36DRAFT_373663 [Talaromyces proteolyticus]|uniref:BRCT domain-containing protein n=1 Tax=Talaromyces proteolyticus TaxID=1131652 RepID=A0AAD4KV89_9EURO|nr:uncharacterized protein BGW36DRAFT_373663 [Talaromyces proteolyticus]KAH8700218.1 hypothetical protein BGW36DRAFT_373663 [Talaromyces proteolyticus]